MDHSAEGYIARQFSEQGTPSVAAGRIYGNLLNALGTEIFGSGCSFIGARQQYGLVSGCQLGRKLTGDAIPVTQDDPQAPGLFDLGGTWATITPLSSDSYGTRSSTPNTWASSNPEAVRA